MSKLREKLFDSYDAHYLRGNALTQGSLDVSAYQNHIPDYEACYSSVLSGLPKGSRILDVGCGIGFLLYWLEHKRPGYFHLTGIDISQPQLAHAKRHLPDVITLVQERASIFLERNTHTFAAVFCTDFLEHVETDDELLQIMELARGSLISGGLLISQVPNMANLTSPHLRYIDLTHSRGFTELSLLQLLECAGFHECQIVTRKAADATQWIRMFTENMIHWVIYRICGVGNERHFQKSIIATGKA